MQFFAPQNFVFLWCIPALVFLFWFSGILWKRRLSRFGVFNTIKTKLIPKYKPREKLVRSILLSLVFFLSVMALARPQWGEEKRKIQRRGVDILFLLDTSLSMMAEDIKPNRLEKSKIEIKTMLQQLKGDRVGMVTFAGSSFLQSPLTLDYSAFLLFLDSIKTGFIPDPGTSLTQALALAFRAFPDKDNKHKAIILFTDGEDHQGGLDGIIDEASKAGVRIYAVGVGTAEGEPIPLKDEQGRRTGFKKDRTGQIVITKANLPLLEKIATQTGGIALPGTPAEQEIDIILKHMQSLGQKQFQEKEITEREDQYQLFLFLAVILMIWEMLFSSNLKVPLKALSLILIFFMTTGFLDTASSLNEEGNKAYQEKKYKTALENYKKARDKSPEDPAIRYNVGSALYQTEQYQEAEKEFDKVIKQSDKNPELKAKALYNYGNTQYRLGKFEKAIESYKKALEINPDDKDAKYNLEFLENQKSMFDKKNQDRKNQKNNQNQNQQNQSQQNNQNNQQNQQQNQQNQQNNQQNQQNQGQGQNNKDQQNQDQNKDQQDKQDQQQNKDQDKKDQQDQQNQDQQDQQEKQDQQSQGQQDQKEDQGQNEKDQQEKEQQQKEQEQQQQDEQDQQGQQDEQKQQQKPQQGQGQGKAPLQGQMGMENALQILDAMKEGEKELQDLRRPPANREPSQVDKDW